MATLNKMMPVLILVLLSACAGKVPDVEVTVNVTGGQVQGVVQNDVITWKGIPFAAPPIGELRWRPPQPVLPWTGVLHADTFKSECAQKPAPADAAPLRVLASEDCLGLNLWKPAAATDAPLPVLVWIYGGGFVNGGSSPAVYDGSAFAQNGVLFVSFNYRLGRFGFFAHPALTAEAGEHGEPLGNYGYLDQIAALKWIKTNIAAFGGDPNNVTVFGESAGGTSVLHLLATPLAAGLFHKASILSGGGRGSLLGNRHLSETSSNGRTSAEATGVAFAKQHGIEGEGPQALSALRALPMEVLIDGLNLDTLWQADDTYAGGPFLDGTIIFQSPQQALESGNWDKMPVLVGSTRADLGFSSASSKAALFAPFGHHAAQARQVYDADGSAALDAVRSALAMDQTMSEPPRFMSKQVTAQGLPAYFYRFSYVPEAMRAHWSTGTPHANELPFVFNTVSTRYGHQLTQKDQDLAAAANAYWANFAKTGDPNGPQLPAWPRYEATSHLVFDFSQDGATAVPDPWQARLDVIERLYEKEQ